MGLTNSDKELLWIFGKGKENFSGGVLLNPITLRVDKMIKHKFKILQEIQQEIRHNFQRMVDHFLYIRQ